MELSTTGAGHKPENLLLGAFLTTAAFFCVSLVTALAKVLVGDDAEFFRRYHPNRRVYTMLLASYYRDSFGERGSSR